jgi:hypothetical protein
MIETTGSTAVAAGGGTLVALCAVGIVLAIAVSARRREAVETV